MAKKKLEQEVTTEPKKAVKKTVKKTTVKKDEKVQEPSSTVEKTVFIYATNDDKLKEVVEKSVNQNVDVVKLSDKVLEDYLAMNKKYKTVKDFVSNADNRLDTKNKAEKLYYILSRGTAIEESKNMVFTMKQAVSETTLTWKTAQQLMELFKAFGFVEFTVPNREFRFIFSENDIQVRIEMEIAETMKLLQNDLERLRASLNSVGKTVNLQETEKRIAEIKKKITRSL